MRNRNEKNWGEYILPLFLSLIINAALFLFLFGVLHPKLTKAIEGYAIFISQ